MRPAQWIKRAVYTDGFKVMEKIHYALCCMGENLGNNQEDKSEFCNQNDELYICTVSGVTKLQYQENPRLYKTTEQGPSKNYFLCGFLYNLHEFNDYENTQIDLISMVGAKYEKIRCSVFKNSKNTLFLAEVKNNKHSGVIGYDSAGFISKWDKNNTLKDIFNYIPEIINCMHIDNQYAYVADCSGILYIYNLTSGACLLERDLRNVVICITSTLCYVYCLNIEGVILKISKSGWIILEQYKREDLFCTKRMIAYENDLLLIGNYEWVEKINTTELTRTKIKFKEFDEQTDTYDFITVIPSDNQIIHGGSNGCACVSTKKGYVYIFEIGNPANYIMYHCGTYSSGITNITFGTDCFYVAFHSGFIARYDLAPITLESYDYQAKCVKKYIMFMYLVLKGINFMSSDGYLIQGLPRDIIGEIIRKL